MIETTSELSCPVPRVWEYVVRPANLLGAAPPDWKVRLVEAPDELTAGARLVLESVRFGMPIRVTNRVAECVALERIVVEQIEGPFRRFRHTFRLEAAGDVARLTDQIEFETPGGLLAFVMSRERVTEMAKQYLTYRLGRFREALEQ